MVLHIVNKGKYGFSGFQLIYNTILYMVALWSVKNVDKNWGNEKRHPQYTL